MTRTLLLAAILLLPSLCAAQPVTLPPSAKELSEPGKLQEWADACVASGETIKLPIGRITGNLFIDDDATTIEGQGSPYGTRPQGTIIVPADATKPAVTIRNAVGCQVKSLGIAGADVGVSLEGSNGALVLNTKLEDVAVVSARVGVQVSEPPGTRLNQNAAADVVINHCRFTLCAKAIELNHPQSVNVHVTGQSYFYRTGTAVWINNGGRVLIADSCCNGLGTWLVLKKGGGNLTPCVLRNLYSDRSGGAAMPVIVDARGCKDRVRVLVDVYSCPYLPADGPWADVKHRHFYGPDGSTDAAKNSIIKVQDLDYFNAPGITNPQ